MSDNITKMPSQNDREFFRVNGHVYLHCEIVDADQGNKKDAAGLFVPTFESEEDDFIGLSIDAFRETVLNDDPVGKDYFLKIQQLLSMTKRFFDAEILGKKHKMYKKLAVNISGSGISFNSDVAYNKGQILRLAMFFPRFPYTFVSVLGEVIRFSKTDAGYETKVQFQEMSQRTEDDILRFVNQCQRDSNNATKG